MPILLVIDDEDSVRYSFEYVFQEEDVRVETAATAAEGLQRFQEHSPDVVVLDLQLPDRSGMEVFQQIHDIDPKRPVIFITAHGTTETAIAAMKSGAFDYLVKPINLDQLTQLITRAFEAARLMRVPAVLPVEREADCIVGRSPIMQEMCKLIGRIASQDVSVLILGESGTGKELVARAIYHHSRRSDKPFLAINCAAMPETLLESELFGHEEGAFTGAQRRRIGKFEQCDGGTLLFDEIGDMAPTLQAKVLRVLQDQRFERVGSNETLQSQVRILAATNQNLEKLVEEGRFRTDLYYRLKVVTIEVPPLRARLDDVTELAHYFLFRFARELGLDVRSFAPEALERLQRHHWPGNVRELQSVIKEAMLKASGHVLLPEFLPNSLGGQRPATDVAECPPILQGVLDLVGSLLQKGEQNLYGQVMEAVERALLARVLAHTHGHQARASELLGISRGTFRQKLRALGLGVDKVVTQDSSTPGPVPE
jgi:two-component system nitrogen regulation response regulator GlnG